MGQTLERKVLKFRTRCAGLARTLRHPLSLPFRLRKNLPYTGIRTDGIPFSDTDGKAHAPGVSRHLLIQTSYEFPSSLGAMKGKADCRP